jgi:hypothetical protein
VFNTTSSGTIRQSAQVPTGLIFLSSPPPPKHHHRPKETPEEQQTTQYQFVANPIVTQRQIRKGSQNSDSAAD